MVNIALLIMAVIDLRNEDYRVAKYHIGETVIHLITAANYLPTGFLVITYVSQKIKLYKWFKNRRRVKIINHNNDSPTINIKFNEEEKGQISEVRELNQQSSINNTSKKIIIRRMDDQTFTNISFNAETVIKSPAKICQNRQNDNPPICETAPPQDQTFMQDIQIYDLNI